MGSAVKISMMFATMYSFRITLGIVGARLRAARCMAGPFRTHAESGSHKLELRNVRVIGFPSSFLSRARTTADALMFFSRHPPGLNIQI